MNKSEMKKKIALVVMTFICIVYLIPIWLILVNSLKSEHQANLLSIGLPAGMKLHFENYLLVFGRRHRSRLLQRPVGSRRLVDSHHGLASLAAFVISRKNTRMMNAVYYTFICGLIIPLLHSSPPICPCD